MVDERNKTQFWVPLLYGTYPMRVTVQTYKPKLSFGPAVKSSFSSNQATNKSNYEIYQRIQFHL